MLKKKTNIYLAFAFFIILATLVSAFIIDYQMNQKPCNLCIYQRIPYIFSIFIGGVIGLISGIIGIGGGIFLSPVLFLLKAAKPKHIITTASVFILINSISGIIGHLTKKFIVIEIQNYIYLLIAVFIGGQIGNFLNLRIFSPKLLALVTAGLVLFVSIRIGLKILIPF